MIFPLISLASMAFGATTVFPCRGFDANKTLYAIHKERYYQC